MLLELIGAIALQGAPNADTLVDQGWALVPAYQGEHRYFLSDEERRHTQAAVHLFSAALELSSEHVRAWRDLGHAEVLLAEDRKNRGLEAEGCAHYEQAVTAFSRAIDLDGADPWTHYAMGALRAGFGSYDAALENFANAIDRAETRIPDTGKDGQDAWIRFKALEWTPEVMMRVGEFDKARMALHGFHSEFSDNEWPLLMALAESYLREHDFSSARDCYEEAISKFPDDFLAYAQLGYVEGLLANSEAAARRLEKALTLEPEPGLYIRLWLWILTEGAARASAEKELREFLRFPPSNFPDWDQALGDYVLGEGPVGALMEAAVTERDGRFQRGAPLEDLLCEAWFYTGLRNELDADQAVTEDQRLKSLTAALSAYRESLALGGESWNWEWSYARLRLAKLAQRMAPEPVIPFHLEGKQIVVGDVIADVDSMRWHIPTSERTIPKEGHDPEPGDLLLAQVRYESGRHSLLRLVVDGRTP